MDSFWSPFADWQLHELYKKCVNNNTINLSHILSVIHSAVSNEINMTSNFRLEPEKLMEKMT